MLRPYITPAGPQDAVNVIRHNNKLVEAHEGKSSPQVKPSIGDDTPVAVILKQ